MSNLDFRVMFAEGDEVVTQTLVHGPATRKVTMGFIYDADTDDLTLHLGNIPAFGGDVEQTIKAIQEVVDLARSVVYDEGLLAELRSSNDEDEAEAEDEEDETEDDEEE